MRVVIEVRLNEFRFVRDCGGTLGWFLKKMRVVEFLSRGHILGPYTGHVASHFIPHPAMWTHCFV